ncbi:MAG: hypothetical protein WCI04_03620 [archaeon]
MPIKKKKKINLSKKSTFLAAEKIASSLEKKKPFASEIKVLVKKTVVESKSPEVVQQSPYSVPKSQDSISGNNLEIIAQKSNSVDELIGFNDLDDAPFENIKLIDNGSGGVVEIIGGATIILILVEVVVLIIILITMFFIK